jgi:predicted dithiol-disulfide oxidoreductase (DUF899 family)
MHSHPTVTRAEWLSARKALLEREKEFTRLGARPDAEGPRRKRPAP